MKRPRREALNDQTSVLVTESGKQPGRKWFRSAECRFWGIASGFTCVILLILVLLVLSLSDLQKEAVGIGVKNDLPLDPYKRALALLEQYPLIDGHNDLPWQLRDRFQNHLKDVNLSLNISEYDHSVVGTMWHTDIPRLRAGRVGGQFWSAWASCECQYKDAVKVYLEQIDVIKNFVNQYPDTFKFATSAADIEEAATTGHIASLIGVEGGHAIDSSLATLRQFYALGARYMTLTHNCNTPWAHCAVVTDTGNHTDFTRLRKQEYMHDYTLDSAVQQWLLELLKMYIEMIPNNVSVGLTDFGKRVIHEMNRLGMMVDISHVNYNTMLDALDTSVAPVIFSHSSAYELCNSPRNVPDDVLHKVAQAGGIVMVNFFPYIVSCSETSSLENVADHIDHIRHVAGIDHVGIGSDFCGIPFAPNGLEDVSKYPHLFAELIRRGYTTTDIKKISRFNILRVLYKVEQIRDQLKHLRPDTTLISSNYVGTCHSTW